VTSVQTIFNSVSVDPNSNTPIYQQLVGKINCIIYTAQLSPGQTLPTIRDLASTLHINPNTVVRAYEELQAKGVISKRQGAGCMVAKSAKSLNSKEKEALLADQIEQLIYSSNNLGVSTRELVRLIELKSIPPTLTNEQNVSRPATREALPATRQVRVSSDIWQPSEEFID